MCVACLPFALHQWKFAEKVSHSPPPSSDLALYIARAPRRQFDTLNSFSGHPRDYVRFNSPVDNMYDSGDPDGKSSMRMLVAIFRLNVKS